MNPHIKKKLDSFTNLYTLIADEKVYDKRIVENGNCRFCGDEGSKNGFRKIAHAIPELFGKNDFTIDDECDSCNSFVSKYESQLADMIRPYITMFNVETKRGVPKFESRSLEGHGEKQDFGKLKIINTATDEKPMSFEIVAGNDQDVEIDEEEKVMHVTTRIRALNPLNVYRAFLKIALSVMPKELREDHIDSYNWVVGRTSTPPNIESWGKAVRIMIPKKVFNNTVVNLFKADKYVFPKDKVVCSEYILVVCFCNVSYQISLPYSTSFHKKLEELKDTKEFHFVRPIYPTFILDSEADENTQLVTDFDFTLDETIDYDDVISFKFGGIERSQRDV